MYFLYLCIVNKRKRTDDDGLINIRITIKEKKGKKIMKKLINKWLKSEYYKEYCINVARMYNFHVAC